MRLASRLCLTHRYAGVGQVGRVLLWNVRNGLAVRPAGGVRIVEEEEAGPARGAVHRSDRCKYASSRHCDHLFLKMIRLL